MPRAARRTRVVFLPAELRELVLAYLALRAVAAPQMPGPNYESRSRTSPGPRTPEPEHEISETGLRRGTARTVFDRSRRQIGRLAREMRQAAEGGEMGSSARLRCGACGRYQRAGALFCDGCGARLNRPILDSGADLRVHAR
jgi:hypothetical protein